MTLAAFVLNWILLFTKIAALIMHELMLGKGGGRISECILSVTLFVFYVFSRNWRQLPYAHFIRHASKKHPLPLPLKELHNSEERNSFPPRFDTSYPSFIKSVSTALRGRISSASIPISLFYPISSSLPSLPLPYFKLSLHMPFLHSDIIINSLPQRIVGEI